MPSSLAEYALGSAHQAGAVTDGAPYLPLLATAWWQRSSGIRMARSEATGSKAR
jgi:hypothetical protein